MKYKMKDIKMYRYFQFINIHLKRMSTMQVVLKGAALFSMFEINTGTGNFYKWVKDEDILDTSHAESHVTIRENPDKTPDYPQYSSKVFHRFTFLLSSRCNKKVLSLQYIVFLI